MYKKIAYIMFAFFLGIVFTSVVFPQSLQTAVAKPKKKVVLKYPEKRILVDDVFRLKLSGTKKKPKWKSSDKHIATVSHKGKVRAKNPGSVKITAYLGKKRYTCEIVIFAKPEPVEKSERERELAEKLQGLREQFPDGKEWTNDNTYTCEANLTIGQGCAALAFEISDILFGVDAPMHKTVDLSNIREKIRIGDIYRMREGEGGHSAVIIDRDADGVVLVEGNFEGKIRWGERMTYEEVEERGLYYSTRYE